MSFNFELRLGGTVQMWPISPTREFRSAFSPVILGLLDLIADSKTEAKELNKIFKKTDFNIMQLSTRLNEIKVCKVYTISYPVMWLSLSADK